MLRDLSQVTSRAVHGRQAARVRAFEPLSRSWSAPRVPVRVAHGLGLRALPATLPGGAHTRWRASSQAHDMPQQVCIPSSRSLPRTDARESSQPQAWSVIMLKRAVSSYSAFVCLRCRRCVARSPGGTARPATRPAHAGRRAVLCKKTYCTAVHGFVLALSLEGGWYDSSW